MAEGRPRNGSRARDSASAGPAAPPGPAPGPGSGPAAAATPAPDLARHLAEHSPEAIRRRLLAGPDPSYLRDFVYGAIDGTVTTFAVVAGVAGAKLSAGVVLILGVANLVADGFSMAVSNYLGTRAEDERKQRSRRREEEHIDRYPEGEREEIRQIYAAKGFVGADLERVVEVLTAERQRWVETMMTEELGYPPDTTDPKKAAWITFLAFVSVGSLPLLTFVYQFLAPASARLEHPFFGSAVATGVAFFTIGAMKGRFVERSGWKSGFETLLMGGAAALLAYGLGAALALLVEAS